MAKDETRLSPVGIAIFPHLSRPTRDMLDKKDVWDVLLELDPKDKEAKDFLNGLSSETKGQYPEGKVPYKMQTDRETGEETGKVIVLFKSSFPPHLFDLYNQDIPSDILIGVESVIQVAFKTNFYSVGDKKGMNLYLQAVQVKKLVEYKGMEAKDYGFEAEEKPPDNGKPNKVADTMPNIPEEYEKDEEKTKEIPF